MPKGTGLNDKQHEAVARNWRIFRLRGFYCSGMGLLSPARHDQFRALVDAELAELGAETEVERRARWQKELDSDG